MKRLLLPLLALSVAFCVQAAQPLSVSSPNGKLKLEVRAETGKPVTYALSFQGQSLISASPISMTLQNGRVLGGADRLKASAVTSHRGSIASPLYKKSTVSDDYNQLLLSFKDFNIVFRAYDEGVAYRFSLVSKRPFNVKAEQATFHFAKDWPCTVPYVRGDFSKRPDPITAQFSNSFENTYTRTVLSKLDAQKLMFLPLIVEADNGVKVNITESALENYPGMFLRNVGGGQELSGVFAPMPSELNTNDAGHLEVPVVKRHDYLTSCNKSASFPWRIISVTSSDEQLLGNDMVYRLAEASRIKDISWIKPGMTSWDWWNDWSLFKVDFKAGINTQTYKYFIDFAARYHVPYVLIDDGWSNRANLFEVVPAMDMPELARYANSKGVGLLLWSSMQAFSKDMDKLCKTYSEMGYKGFKVDFIDRDDAQAENFLYKVAATAAKYHMIIDFHGIHKPAGITRTYPNVVNMEGVDGQENVKWATIAQFDQTTYDVTVPFLRNMAGPMDYTQGAMLNGTRSSYRPSNSQPMSQNTRAHQLAEYVVFFSPLNMLCDSPTRYMDNDACTRFIATCPTVWDETVPLKSKLGEYVAVARRKGSTWYVGAITGWTARDLSLDLSFLKSGDFKAETFADGPNVDKVGEDYQQNTVDVPSNRVMKVHLAAAGGFVMKITRK
ncbi:MAG: glycoside hydrolase family 97 protein [Prevotella sp.]|nr:glycoside hydrolase family 97 protein [Prevotella sp.]